MYDCITTHINEYILKYILPLRSSALLNIGINDKYCSLLSILAYLHPCNNNVLSNRVSIFKRYFNELNLDGFDFTNGFRRSDVHKFEKLNNLSINIIEFNFYQDQNKWSHKINSIEISENDSDRVID